MAESETAEDKERWTTGEELLLAYAVMRYGFNNWDSVAMELQTRISHLPLLLTPQNCQRKYTDLKLRFMDSAGNEDGGAGGKIESGDRMRFHIPWLDELRKLRVAELRQEVHRYDVSILSLQSKVKKLKEERDLSSRDEEIKNEKSDLEKDSKEERLDIGANDGDGGEPEERLTHRTAGKSVSGEESDRGNRSCNESNSTGARDEKPNAGSDDAEKETEQQPFQTGSEEPDPDSYKGSTDTQPAKKAESGGESRDDLAAVEEESKEEEDVMKESSDVQSSASLTRMRRRRCFRRRRGKKENPGAGFSSGDEPETDGSHAIIKINSVELEPLIALLQIIRSHEHSSFFENPLQSQEKGYRSLVRQHMDLQTIETRLRQGSYFSSTHKFYRDLLLLFTNFIIFFPKASPESVAARELRRLVSNVELEKETLMSSEDPIPTPPPPPQQRDPLPSQQKLANPKRPDETLLAKHKSSVPIVVCRKRSSLSAAKASATTSSTKKAELQSDDRKPALDGRLPTKPFPRLSGEEQINLRMKETMSLMTGARSSRRSTKNHEIAAAVATIKKQSTGTTSKSPGLVEKAERTPKTEKRNKAAAGTASGSSKKQRDAAADFLKRIKLYSSRSPGGNTDSSGGREHNTRGRNGRNTQGGNTAKGDKKEDGGPVRSAGGGGKQVKDEESPLKPKVRRPLKRVADPSAKRKRTWEDNTDKEAEVVAVASNRRRKRVRR